MANKTGLSADIIYELEKENLQTVLKEAKLHSEEKLVDQINVNEKRFWNYTRHFTKSSSTISDLNFEGRNVSDDQTKANTLNNYFIYVLTDELELLHSLTFPLAYIFNKSIQTSQTLQDWRDANVTPIRKKGPRNKCNNYSPAKWLNCYTE